MASHKAFVDYITEQLGGAGEIRAKTMFGEYGLYCDGQFFAVICEDQLFLKCTPRGGCVPPPAQSPALPRGQGFPAGGGRRGPGPAGPPDPNHLCRPGRPTQEGKEEATHAHRL